MLRAAAGGDVTRDGYITTRDHVQWHNTLSSGATGYLSADFTGDGLIDENGLSLWRANAVTGRTTW